MRLAAPVLALAACATSPHRTPTTAPPGATGAPIEIRGLTAAGGVLPWRVFDRADGVCAWQAYYHVEGIDTATGRAVWAASDWTDVIGELPDGGVVVSNGGFGGSGDYRVAALERKDGRERWSCAATFPATPTDVAWGAATGGLFGMPFVQRAPSGIAQPTPAPLPTVWLTVSTDGCAIIAGDRDRGPVGPPPSAPRPWIAGDLEVRAEAGPQPMTIDAPTTTVLIGARAGVEVWRRTFNGAPMIPCNLP